MNKKKTTFSKPTGDFVVTPELTDKFDSYQIHGGKLKDRTYLTPSFSQKTEWDSWRSGNMEYPDTVHDDLRTAFSKLHVHFAIISEQVVVPKNSDMSIDDILSDETMKEIIEAMGVSEFKISGSGSNEGVQLVGTKVLSTGEVLTLKTPTRKWEDEQHPYLFADELSQAIEACKFEILLFMHGKHAPDKMPELPLEVEEETVEA